MTKRLMPICAGIVTSALFASAAVRGSQESGNLTVHEWGTFTAVAGADGRPVQWLALSGQNDLPCFVKRAPAVPEKSRLWATVRMETPVLYFYAPGQTKVDVSVRFPLGLMTEYFPPANVRGGSLAWSAVRIDPGSAAEFLVEEGSSHYYAARDTVAAPLQVGAHTERFLFYRGAGSFPLPVAATVDRSGDVTVTSPTGGSIGKVVLFENRGGAAGYRIVDVDKQATIQRPSLGRTVPALTSELEGLLTDHGLYRKEAAAMVATWRDSWFEEGTRLLYIMAPQAVDAVLPLRIKPRPAQIARVFVGRLELITTALMDDVSRATRSNDWTSLSTHARFLHPITDRIAADSTLPDRKVLEHRLRSAASSFSAATDACSR